MFRASPYAFNRLTVHENGRRCTGLWTVPRDLPYFDGHFPDLPVVPAAMIMEVSLAFLREATGDPALAVTRARHCKFKGAVTPEATLRIEAGVDAERLWRIIWSAAGPDGAPSDAIVQLELSASS